MFPIAPADKGTTEIGYWRKAYAVSDYLRQVLEIYDDFNLEDKEVGITTFAFVLTLPLVYVFIAILPLAAKATTTGMPAFEELFVVDQVMRTDNILKGFMAWFGSGPFLWVVLVFMLLLSILFLLEPLFAGICVTKGKILNIVGKNKDGKVRLFCTDELPVLKQQREEAESSMQDEEDSQEPESALETLVAPACDALKE